MYISTDIEQIILQYIIQHTMLHAIQRVPNGPFSHSRSHNVICYDYVICYEKRDCLGKMVVWNKLCMTMSNLLQTFYKCVFVSINNYYVQCIATNMEQITLQYITWYMHMQHAPRYKQKSIDEQIKCLLCDSPPQMMHFCSLIWQKMTRKSYGWQLYSLSLLAQMGEQYTHYCGQNQQTQYYMWQ